MYIWIFLFFGRCVVFFIRNYFWVFFFLLICTIPFSLEGYGGTFFKLFNQKVGVKPTSFLLSKVTFDCDIPFSKDEFYYLTDLSPNKIVTPEKVEKACRFLISKKRFNLVNVDVFDYGVGKHLHFKLSANWIFNRLRLSGIWFGKQKYIGLYTQQPGDIFDFVLHKESVKSIKKFLNDQGFFDSKIDDEIVYNKKYKTIDAGIKISRGKRFTVKNVFCKINDEKHSDFESILNKKFGNILLNTTYTKKAFKKQAKKIISFLNGKSFVGSRVNLKRNINLKKCTLDLIFDIQIGRLKLIKFEGNTFFSDQKIKHDFIGFDQPEWLFSPDVISEQLRHEYYKRGYWSTSIDYKKITNEGYIFKIKEGESVSIQAVEVRDEKMNILESNVLFWDKFIQSNTFDQDELDSGISRLRDFYLFQGFWDFKIVDKRFVKIPETNSYIIQISIDKGIQRFWGGIQIDNFPEIESMDFFKKYTPQDGIELVPFDLNWLYEQRIFLLDYFKKIGYWYADIEPELIQLDDCDSDLNKSLGSKVAVKWKIDLGEKVKFGKILLRGNTKIPFKEIVRDVKFREGEDWNRKKIEQTRSKLKKLDVFKTVQIQPYQMSKDIGEKPIILSLIDDDPVELRLRAGYFITSKNFLFKSQTTPKIGSSFILKNPLNKADKFSFDFDWTLFERKFDTQYQLPSLFDYSVLTKFKIYANKYIQPVQIGKTDPAYTAIQNGFLVGFSDEYKECYHWGLNFGNEWMMTKNIHGYLDLSEKLENLSVPYFFMEPSLLVDKLDDRLNPKKGSLSFASLKFMVPEKIGIVSARLQLEQSLFYPIYKNMILGARVRFGHMFRRDFEDIMPIERFYLGGPYSLRGYEIDSLPPLGVTEKDPSGRIINQYTAYSIRNCLPHGFSREYTIQGGSSMINTNLELRVPLFKNFYGAIFEDFGALSQSGVNGFKVWFPSSGLGLRYKTPIGSIRFDVGWKWKKRFPNECGYGWYLVIGESF